MIQLLFFGQKLKIRKDDLVEPHVKIFKFKKNDDDDGKGSRG